jgi:ATPase family AAA domain-containing protein 3A/B
MAARRAGALLAAAGAAALVAAPTIAMAEDKSKQVEQALKTMFDPEALERGAKALREINKSPNAKQVSRNPTRRVPCALLATPPC